MSRYLALLRAINVGGHTLKMDLLRAEFEALGFTAVETFIASGNVIFESSLNDEATLVGTIEDRLRNTLGYEVATFLRTPERLAAVAFFDAFTGQALPPEGALNVGFTAQTVGRGAVEALKRLESEVDQFRCDGREIYWRSTVRQSQSRISGATIERAIRAQSTFRGINTVRRLAAKYGPGRP